MAKIDKLTVQQEKDLVAYRDEWLAIGRSVAPADRSCAEAAITKMYEFLGCPRPYFWWCDGPAVGSLVRAVLKSNLGDNLWANLRANLRDNLRDIYGWWAHGEYTEQKCWTEDCDGQVSKGKIRFFRTGNIAVRNHRGFWYAALSDGTFNGSRCYMKKWWISSAKPPIGGGRA